MPPLAWGSVLATLLVVGAVLVPGPDPDPRQARVAADRTAPLAVLRAWDRDRAAAWRQGDLHALRDLYVPGSPAGRADRAMLRAYAQRGLRVTGLRMQLASVRVVRADDARMVLLVTDRLATATAVGPAVRRPLPRDRWSTSRLLMVREAGERWRVARVAAQPKAEAMTLETSGSSNR